MRIFLFGYMGSGKTTHGKKIAKALSLDFIDLDEYLEKKLDITIKYIFETQGEDKFRELENQVLLELVEKDNFLMATGGGTPCFYGNLEIMKEKGLTVYLEAGIGTLVNRLMNAKTHRPLVFGKSGDELYDYIQKALRKRSKFYNRADITVGAEGLNVNNLKEIVLKKAAMRKY